ncbi:cytochrome c [Chelatococcus composti]|jgi:mono/diheme cytochrome c family protein|uniref:Mono/diheme cytochrome c family protein n=1 Tax=Chelatococcus composti TaxID=1743235 RepID=A0A841K8R8_9HYPH|nr:cytochrome c [Chelatococcus composti]MBB6166436.1 mono/diheme cytochrome c family protein [Chelatococcus composti]MBS7734633.1 c-type cytochrome [Chelatococcus composti]GGG28363.1 diacylglycerol kinase [Chelatococcus composti]
MRRALMAVLGLAVVGAGAFWIATSPALTASGADEAPGGVPDLANGELMFYAGGCSSCHATEGQDDKLKLGGGHALETAFGTFHVPNISPHPRDGIGAWSEADFIRAMRHGVSPDGEHYYPAFPYTSYQRMTAQDLRDMFAFIRTLPPVEGKAPPHNLSFPFNIRRGLGLWKLAFLDGKEFRPDPSKSEAWNRGAYLVEGPGHCAECHSPRNALGAIIEEARFAGGRSPDGKGSVPNITPSPDGIGSWSKDEVVELLTSGFTPEFDSVGSTMAPVIGNTSKLPQADREAMAEYLLSLPPRPKATQ